MRIDLRVSLGLIAATVALVVWLLLPRQFWIDFTFATIIFGVLLAGLRWSAAKQSVDQDLGPGARHQTRTTAQWDPPLLSTHQAVAAYLDTGDPAPLDGRLPPGDVREQVAPLLASSRPRPMQLIGPMWSYIGLGLGTLIAVWSIAATIVQQLGADVLDVLPWAFGLAGIITYIRFLNRYGAPWWVELAWGNAGIALILVGLAFVPELLAALFTQVPEYSVPILLAMVGFTFVAYPHARRVKPLFVAERVDPEALQALRSKQLRDMAGIAIVASITIAFVLGLLTIRGMPGDLRELFSFFFGLLPGVAIGILCMPLARIIGIAVSGPTSMQRLQKRRDKRSRRIIRLLTDVRP